MDTERASLAGGDFALEAGGGGVGANLGKIDEWTAGVGVGVAVAVAVGVGVGV